jgi:rod shape-determining protein MreD
MTEMDLSPASRSPMELPAPVSLILVSVLLALLANLLPWTGVALRTHPDFVLLLLLYWSLHEPRAIGQGWGFTLGLVMDVADSVLLGQHALVYVVAIFLAQLLRVRLLRLTPFEQALHVLAILLVSQGLGVLLNLSMGREFPGAILVIAPLLAAVLWPIVDLMAKVSRFRRSSRDVVI